MSSVLALRDHREVQSAALRAGLAGAAAGLVHALAPGPLAAALALGAVTVAAVPPRSWRCAAAASLLACAGGAAVLLPPFAGALLLAGCGAALYARGAGSPGRAVAAGIAGVTALACGLFVAAGLREGLLVGVAPALGWMAAGGAAGLCAGLGVVGRELTWQPERPPEHGLDGGARPACLDRPDERGGLADRAAAPTSDGPAALAGELAPVGSELAELLGRASLACASARASLGDEAPAAARAAADLLRRLGAFAQRWRDLDRQLGGVERDALTARLERMVQRADDATDDEVRNDYLRAGRALRQQLADLDAIRGWHERSLARLHHHVAVMERLRLAALHRRSVDAGRNGDELSDLVDELATAGLELDGTAEALAALPSPAR